MELHSMKRTPKEKKTTGGPTEVVEPMADDYPYGLEISLEKESLAKLGLDIDDFIVGGEVEMVCHAEVTRTHESAGKNDISASVSIQITDIAMLARPKKKISKLRDLFFKAKGEIDE